MEDLVNLSCELQSKVESLQQSNHEYYQQNIQSLATIIKLQKQNSVLEDSYLKEIQNYQLRTESLVNVIDAQQSKIESYQDMFSIHKHWKSLLPLCSNDIHLHTQNKDHFKMAVNVLCHLTTNYINEAASQDSVDSNESRQQHFTTQLLQTISLLVSQMRATHEEKSESFQLRNLLQNQSAAYSRIQSKIDAMSIEKERTDMKYEELRHALQHALERESEWKATHLSQLTSLNQCRQELVEVRLDNSKLKEQLDVATEYILECLPLPAGETTTQLKTIHSTPDMSLISPIRPSHSKDKVSKNHIRPKIKNMSDFSPSLRREAQATISLIDRIMTK